MILWSTIDASFLTSLILPSGGALLWWYLHSMACPTVVQPTAHSGWGFFVPAVLTESTLGWQIIFRGSCDMDVKLRRWPWSTEDQGTETRKCGKETLESLIVRALLAAEHSQDCRRRCPATVSLYRLHTNAWFKCLRWSSQAFLTPSDVTVMGLGHYSTVLFRFLIGFPTASFPYILNALILQVAFLVYNPNTPAI